MKKKLPIGIESFNEIRNDGFYYVDKTRFIKDLLYSGSKVNLFTRPRRFGKSLNMDMLKAFFEIGADVSLFNGLEISKEKELCDKYMGKFPVLFVSFKSVEGTTFEDAKDMLESVVNCVYQKRQIWNRIGSIVVVMILYAIFFKILQPLQEKI